ncbi:MAG: class I SAM-dependent methyltransferase [Gemmatimonadota bacterium]|nr:class I SAM-dependent methyltransferase [Gemmatimonadota bacterium]
MALSTRLKEALNRGLRPLNLGLRTLTAEQAELARLKGLEARGYFDEPAFPVPDSVRDSDHTAVVELLKLYRDEIARLASPETNDVGYRLDNIFYGSPDAEVLYCLVRDLAPRRIVEVGSGNSTRIMRQAIIDGGLDAEVVCIDPQPRVEVESVADRVIRKRLEDLEIDAFAEIASGDMVFFDSSHRVDTGNDVVRFFLSVLPALPAGAVVHVHDVFLPYEYPREWVIDQRWGWGEQYVLQAYLQAATDVEVLWAGHHVQRSRSDFDDWFPQRTGRAQSLWLRTGPRVGSAIASARQADGVETSKVFAT